MKFLYQLEGCSVKRGHMAVLGAFYCGSSWLITHQCKLAEGVSVRSVRNSRPHLLVFLGWITLAIHDSTLSAKASLFRILYWVLPRYLFLNTNHLFLFLIILNSLVWIIFWMIYWAILAWECRPSCRLSWYCWWRGSWCGALFIRLCCCYRWFSRACRNNNTYFSTNKNIKFVTFLAICNNIRIGRMKFIDHPPKYLTHLLGG